MADGRIKIDIEVDGKPVRAASRELDRLEESGHRSGKGVKSAESSMDSLSDSSNKAGSSVKGASDSLEDLGDSGSRASSGIKGAEGSVDGLSDSSAEASSSVKGTSDSLDNLSDSGSKASSGVKGAEGSVDGLSDSSADASSSVKGTADSLDGLGDSGSKASSGVKGAESSVDGLSDSSSDATSSVRGASESLEGLGDSGSKASDGLKGADSSIDGVADSSSDATSSVRGASDSLDTLGDSGSRASSGIKGAEGSVDSLSDSSSDAASNVQGTSSSLDGLTDSAGEAASSAKQVSDETEGMGEQTEQASNSTEKLAVSIGLIAIAATAFTVLKDAMDDAISRFDTLNQFPKVMDAMGVSAEESEQAMSNLSDGIEGLPTTLDDITGSAQEMYTSFEDMDQATDTALALNNALLGSGASAAQAKRGTQQYTKALQTDQMYLSTWNTLSETMGVGLIKIAEGFGYAGKSAKNDLYQALQDGTITMDDFNDQLIEVGTGTGIMADLAKENSLGIATSLTNLKNTASRGLADILESFNEFSKAVTGKDIAENIDSLKHIVNASFQAIGSVIESTIPFVQGFATAVETVMPVVEALTPALLGMAAAYAMHAVINATVGALQNLLAVTRIVITTQDLFTPALAKNTITQAASGTSTAVLTAGRVCFTPAMSALSIVVGVLTGTTTLYAAAQTIATAAAGAFSAVLGFLTGPIGWVTLAIGALVGAVMGIVAWFNSTSEEAEILNDKNEELEESTAALTEELNTSAEGHEGNITEINASAEANQELAEGIEDLAGKENKSAAEKALLQSQIETLNGSVEGLNLAYDEEADALSMSSEELEARVGLMKDMAAQEEGQARLLEISTEQSKIDEKLEEINKSKEESNRLEEEGTITKSEHKKAIADLNEVEDEATATKKKLGDQQKETESIINTATESITEITESGVANQTIAFEDLEESQQATVESMKESWEEYKDAATDMFDVMNDEIEITASEMASNLEENQRIIGDWSENIAELAERGVDDGLLDTLREAGPESAGHVNALVNASDEELKELSTSFEKGGDVATDALSESLGIEKSGVMEAVGHLVTDTESSLSQQVKDANFESIGEDVADGYGDGIDKGAIGPRDAAKEMAEGTTKATKEALDTHSPSVVFKDIGTDVTDGLALGINQGTRKVMDAINKMFKSVETHSAKSFKGITKGYDDAVQQIERSLSKLPQVTQKSMGDALKALSDSSKRQLNAMKMLNRDYDREIKNIGKSLDKLPKMAQKSMSNMLDRLRSGADRQTNIMRALSKTLVSPFSSTPSQFRNIGVNAMSGLTSGLNAGRGQVMSTARGIADSVASTMKKSLRIKSPSQLMRDDVGKMIPAGIAVGIRDNAKMAYKEIDALSSGMIMSSSPEQALGTSRMAYTGAGNQIADAVKNLKTPSGGNNELVSILSEQNSILTRILGKTPDLYIDGEKVTDIVNGNNAIIASTKYF